MSDRALVPVPDRPTVPAGPGAPLQIIARTVVSLMGIGELAGIANSDGLTLGATTILDEVAGSALVRAGWRIRCLRESSCR